MTKYGKKAQKKIKKVMHEYGEGKLKSGKSKKKVTSQKQAVAIGISEARKAGTKVPKKSAAKKTTAKKTATKKSAPKKTTAKKSTAKKSPAKKRTVKKK